LQGSITAAGRNLRKKKVILIAMHQEVKNAHRKVCTSMFVGYHSHSRLAADSSNG
jgi:hypothetical protein